MYGILEVLTVQRLFLAAHVTPDMTNPLYDTNRMTHTHIEEGGGGRVEHQASEQRLQTHISQWWRDRASNICSI